MFLEKWYGDVVDGNRVEIRYRANLKLGPVVIGYVGSITSCARTRSVFVPGGVELPREVGGVLRWPASGSGECDAPSWAGSHARAIALWQSGTHSLLWNPQVLRGAVSGSGLSPDARGYVEKLTLDFGPWQLGMKRLRWGRFCGERHSLVWIEWEGRHPRQLVLLDGQARALHEASRDGIRCAGASLDLARRQCLIEEPMSEGALRGLRLPRQLAALQFLRGRETKWFAPAVLVIDGGDAHPGDAIFEEVVWP